MKNVELTDQSSERGADDNDFIGPSVYGDSIYKGNLTYLPFEYISHAYFLIDLTMPSQARPSLVDLSLTHKKSSSYLY